MLFNFLVVVLALALALAFLLLPGESDLLHRRPFWGVSFAHRGLHTADQQVPENSLEAFTAAIAQGYGIELDLQLTKDGHVVVFHDDTLKRACGLDARVDELDYEQLKELTLFDSTQKIPHIVDALQCVGGKAPLVIELKTNARYKELCENTWRVLRRYDGDLCVQSFDPRIVRWFMKNAPGVLRGQLSAPRETLGTGVQKLAVSFLLTNFLGRPGFIAYEAGPRPWTVRLVMRLCMRATWTVRGEEALPPAQETSDMVIFEYITPEPRFKEPPEETDIRAYEFLEEEEPVFLQPGPSFRQKLKEERQPEPEDAPERPKGEKAPGKEKEGELPEKLPETGD